MKFPVVVAMIFFGTFSLVFWIVSGAPVPSVKVVPLQPNKAQPAFADVRRQLETDAAAGRPGTAAPRYIPASVNPDTLETDGHAKRTKLRNATLLALDTYKNDSCSAEKREQLISAIDTYMEGLRRSGADFKAEIDRYIFSRIQDAAREGLILMPELGTGGQLVLIDAYISNPPEKHFRCSVGRDGRPIPPMFPEP